MPVDFEMFKSQSVMFGSILFAATVVKCLMCAPEPKPKSRLPRKAKENQNGEILFIQTGGTIDKGYPKMKMGYAFEIGEPAVHSILQNVDHLLQPDFQTACRKDSTEIFGSDRRTILDMCMRSEAKSIVITHGTDTMIQTGMYLNEQMPEKTIVLTGAMRPAKFKDSDAAFNVGFAIASVLIAPPGVYIAMNAQCCEITEASRGEDGKFWRNEDNAEPEHLTEKGEMLARALKRHHTLEESDGELVDAAEEIANQAQGQDKKNSVLYAALDRHRRRTQSKTNLLGRVNSVSPSRSPPPASNKK